MPVNAVVDFHAENDGDKLIVDATTWLPASPVLLTFCCPYRLLPKTRKRGGQEVPHGNLIYLDCVPKTFDPTGPSGPTSFRWEIPNSDYLPCDDCHLAVVELELHARVAWSTQVYPCPPVPVPAVRFDGDTWFYSAALPVAPSSWLSWSYWFRVPLGANGSDNFITDPDAVVNNFPYDNTDSPVDGYGFSIESDSNDPLDPSYGARLRQFAPAFVSDGLWHHVLASVDVSPSGDVAKFGAIYIDGAYDTGYPLDPSEDNRGGGFLIAQAGVPLSLFGYPPDGDALVADIAEFWWAYGQTLLVGGLIPPATIAKFLAADGTPVPLGDHGELPTGTLPTVFGHGKALSFMQPNLGDGGGFALNGTLLDAPSSPKVGT